MLCSAQGLHATECTGCGERRALLPPSRFHPLPKAGEGEQPFAPTPSLTRVHRLSSVCRKRTLVCPHPQPLSHAVGEGRRAHGGAPCRVFPLARLRERGTKRVRAKKARLPHGEGARKIVLAPEILYPKAVPLLATRSPIEWERGLGKCRPRRRR